MAMLFPLFFLFILTFIKTCCNVLILSNLHDLCVTSVTRLYNFI